MAEEWMDSDRLFQRAVRQVLYPTKRGRLCLRGV